MEDRRVLRKLQVASAPKGTGTGTLLPTAATAPVRPGVADGARWGEEEWPGEAVGALFREMPHPHRLISLGFVLYNSPPRRKGSALT